MKPSSEFQSAGKFEGCSENRASFLPWQARPSSPFIPQNNSRFDANGKDSRDFQTTNSSSFNDKGYQVRRSRAPQQQQTDSVPFQGSSESHSAFTAMPNAKREPFKPVTLRAEAQETRDFKTTSASAMPNRGYIKPVQPILPLRGADLGSHANFEGISQAKADFVHHTGARPASPFIPIRSQLGEKDAKFEGTTAYSSCFQGTRGTVAPSMKPSSEFHSAGKFEGESINRSEFKAWDAPRTQILRPKQGQHTVDENRNFQTENSSQFNDKGYQVRRSRQPPQQTVDSVPFQGVSETASAFTAKQPEYTFPKQPTYNPRHKDTTLW